MIMILWNPIYAIRSAKASQSLSPSHIGLFLQANLAASTSAIHHYEG